MEGNLKKKIIKLSMEFDIVGRSIELSITNLHQLGDPHNSQHCIWASEAILLTLDN